MSLGPGHTCGLGPAELGGHLLGHLDPRDDAAVHEAGRACMACATEVPALRSVVQALRHADPRAVTGTGPDGAVEHEADVPLAVPTGALDDMLRRVGAERRRAGRRRLLLAAAALVVGLALGSGGAVYLVGRDDDRQVVRLAGGDGASGRMVLVETDNGARVDLEVRGLDPGRTYGAWLAREDGRRTPAGSFRADDAGAARVSLSAALAPQEADLVGVTLIGGADVLLSRGG